jgi:hypothetical protein
MPWKAFRHDNEWCVFKLNADDEATGDSLGCHDTRAEANAQVAALNINVEEQGQMNDTMLESTTLEIDGEQPVTLATLIDTYKEAHRHEWGGEGPSVEMMPDGAWSARSFADLAAARVAEEMAATVEQRTEEFKLIFNNIMRDPEISNKRMALMSLVDEFVTEIEGIEPTEETVENADGLSELAESETLSILEVLDIAEQEEDEEPQHTMVRVAVIEPGLGNKRDKHYYGAEMLERDAHVFEGVKMYLTEHDDKNRSVRTEVSQIVKCPVGFSETGAPLGDVAIYDAAFAHNVRERDHHGTLSDLHCSILASGRVKKGVEMDGDKVNVVEAITEARAVDWVTRAGAGGRALSLVENDVTPEGNMTDEIVLDEGQSGEEEHDQETVEEQLHEQDDQQEEVQPEPLTASEALNALLESGLSAKQQKRIAAKGHETLGELEADIAETKEILSESRPSTVLGMGKSKPQQQEADTRTVAERERGVLQKHGLGGGN